MSPWRGLRRLLLGEYDSLTTCSRCSREGYPRLCGEDAGDLRLCRITQAHLRLRGEDSSNSTRRVWSMGSSPAKRGGRQGGLPAATLDGLIPACAGRATPSSRRSQRSLAHPHMRGEGPVERELHPSHDGSSPYARGGPQNDRVEVVKTRLIPACAGRAPSGSCVWSARSAHPRMRGEGDGVTQSLSFPTGSSPHARGGRGQPLSRLPFHRLIPACAGRARSPGW